MNWFRFYHEALEDPKVQRLDGETFKSWVNLLCLASRAKHRGTLPPVHDIAFALRMDEEATGTLIYYLIERELLEPIPGGFAPHNWHERQPRSDDINARVRKHREAAKPEETLRETLQVTPPVTKRPVTRNGADKRREEEIREESTPLPPSGEGGGERSQPWALLEAMCDELGQDATALPERDRGIQLRAAKQLADAGASPDDMRAMVRWLSSQRWVVQGGGLDMKVLAGQHGKWVMNGRPDSPPEDKTWSNKSGRSSGANAQPSRDSLRDQLRKDAEAMKAGTARGASY